MMALLKFNSVGIRAISACVPPKINNNSDLVKLVPKEEVDKTISNIGIKEKRYAEKHVCASDLCYQAAEHLLDSLKIERDTIDMLIFMSQTSDYRIPATAPILQNKLGLSKTCGAFDINLGCSGYVYSLSTAFAYASISGINRILLLDGETFSKITSNKDKVNYPLYGDAGTATLIENGNFEESTFMLYSDGKGEGAVKVKAGGMRFPANDNNVKVKLQEDGNYRSDHHIYMDGVEVFNFTMNEVPKSIKTLIKETYTNLNEIDYIVFHQANKFMTDFFSMRLKYPLEKVPYCIDRFGNTSSASIPLTISDQLSNVEMSGKKIIMSGFGAGLSWATAMMSLQNCKVFNVIDYKE